MPSVLPSVWPLSHSASPESPVGWSQECIRPDFGCEALRRSPYAMWSPHWKSLSCNEVCLKSKPPWAQWLLWFRQKAAGFPQIRNKMGTAPRSLGSFSVLPRHEWGHLLPIWACLWSPSAALSCALHHLEGSETPVKRQIRNRVTYLKASTRSVWKRLIPTGKSFVLGNNFMPKHRLKGYCLYLGIVAHACLWSLAHGSWGRRIISLRPAGLCSKSWFQITKQTNQP